MNGDNESGSRKLSASGVMLPQSGPGYTPCASDTLITEMTMVGERSLRRLNSSARLSLCSPIEWAAFMPRNSLYILLISALPVGAIFTVSLMAYLR